MTKIDELESRLGAAESRLSVVDFQQSHLMNRSERHDNKLEALAERLTRLEEKVNALPNKEYIHRVSVAVIGAVLLFLGLQVAYWKASEKPVEAAVVKPEAK